MTARSLVTSLATQWDVAIGIGRQVPGFRDLPQSRREADHVLRVLFAEREHTDRRVARLADVQLQSLLLTIAELDASGQRISDIPLATLVDYDAESGTDLIETMDVFLECWGNVHRAAERLHIHQNTLRYRIQRACEIGSIDLNDADQRLAVTLALRLRRFRAGGDPR